MPRPIARRRPIPLARAKTPRAALVAALIAALYALPATGDAADLVWSPPEVAGGAVDSAALLSAELAAAGRSAVTVGSISGLALSAYDAVWVTLGIHPHARALTLAEGDQLRQYLLGGGTVFIEGGDHWGFDPPTPLGTIDGIVGIADGVGDLFAIEGVSASNGGDLAALAAPHTGENAFIDRLAPDRPGAGVVLRKSGGGYAVGVLHVGALSGLGDHRLLGLSFEFGGWGGSRADLLAGILDLLALAPPCPLAAPDLASCALVAGGASLAWTNLAPVTSIEVLRDGVEIAILAPGATTYFDPAPPAGAHEYRVRARDGATCQALSLPCALVVPAAVAIRRGDVDGSETLDISDPIRLLLALFAQGPAPACADAADVDDSGAIDVADPIALLLALYQGGATPPALGVCAFDATPDPLAPCAPSCAP